MKYPIEQYEKLVKEDWAQWLFDWFNESQTVEIEVQKALENR